MTTMYRIEDGKVITHEFPWNTKNSPLKFKFFQTRGFTFERPNLCEVCGATFDKRIALEGHRRSHK